MLKSGKILILGLIALAVLAAFSLFVVYEERKFERSGQEDTLGYGRQIAPYLWDINVETAQEYVDAVEEMNNFHFVEVCHSDGQIFVKHEALEPDEGLDGILRSMGLLRETSFTSQIHYHGRDIGAIHTQRTNKNVYIYLYTLPLALLLFAIIVLFRILLADKEKRSRVEDELEMTKQRLSSVVSGTPVIAVSLDQGGKVIFCEGKGLSKLGLTAASLLGKSVHEATGALPLSESDFKQALKGESFSMVHEAGGYTFETCYFPSAEKGGGVTAVSTDITAVLEAVSQLRRQDSELEQEMMMARDAHQAIMTTEVPEVPGLTLGMVFKPSKAVGGDVVHFSQERKGELGVTLCDIRGHGVAAALLSSAFLYMLDDALGEYGDDLERLFTELNERIHRHFPRDRYASASHVRIDVASQKLHYVLGSKEPVVIFGKGHEPICLMEGAHVLGSSRNSKYEEKTLQLETGDVVLVFTDGIYDVTDPQGLQLSRNQLLKWVDANLELDPQELLDSTYKRVAQFSADGHFRDDVTAIAIRID